MAKDTAKKLRNLMMYQVFVRNYSKEGTFEALERDLDRIKKLGADIIYLLPVHPIGAVARKGSLGSPYAISDYRAVNPEYGTMDDFERLVNAIHEKGMKCMIDVVYNHTSPDSVLSKEHPEWFYRKADGSFGNRVGDWSDIIDLDYSNEGLWNYQIETLRYWARIVDGFRCDVAPLVPVEFWLRARKEVSEIKKDFIWLAESVEPDFLLHLRGRGITAHSDSEIFEAFDVSYDYDIYPAFTGYLTGRSSLSKYVDDINRQEYIYPDNYVKIRFLENHDQSRAHFLIPDKKALENFTAFSFFQKGMAFVYAGQEFGASHLPSLFDRDTVLMEPEGGTDLSELIRTLSAMKKNELFTDSVYKVTGDEKDVITAVHEKDEKIAAGVFSMSGKAANAYIPLKDGYYTNVLNNREYEVFRNRINTGGEPVIILNY
ncbi:MAG: alpha-amylase [Oribacterium sp.]|nr:alpha-amylase [Oribacterium sp.]